MSFAALLDLMGEDVRVFSVFVNNIPTRVHWRWLRKIFQWHGTVIDVFIPKKRSSSGKKFGFVHFASLREAKTAVGRLNGAWILDHRIKAENSDSYSSQNGTSSIVPLKPTYLQALRYGLDDKVSADFHYGLQSKVSSSGQEMKKCVAVCDKEALARLRNCYIGTILGNLDTESLLENFKTEDYVGVSVRKLSGNQVLLDFEEMKDRYAFVNWKSTWLSDWFSNLQPWSMDQNAFVRTTWLKCFGVPIHLSNHGTFRNIAMLWGDFVAIDGNTLALDDFSFGLVLIRTHLLQTIDESIDMFVVSETNSEELPCPYCHCYSKANLRCSPPSPGYGFKMDVAMVEHGLKDEHAQSIEGGDKTLSSFNENNKFQKVEPDNGCMRAANLGNGITLFNASILDECVVDDDRLGFDNTVPETNGDELELANHANMYHMIEKEVSVFNVEALVEGDEMAKLNLDGNKGDRLVLNPLGSGGLCRIEGLIERTTSPCNFGLSKEPLMLEVGRTNELRGNISLETCSVDRISKGRCKSYSILDLGLSNKRGAKSIVEIEDKIIDNLYKKKGRRRGRRKNNIFRVIKWKVSDSRIVNASLSNSDFKKRKQVLWSKRKEHVISKDFEVAKDTWELGKMLGFSANCNDSIIIKELVELRNREKK
ncbi:hypothetical protein REPUB_Repub07fG0233500 [Reevesia pubescens]